MVTVGVLSSDPWASAGAASYLRAREDIELVPEQELGRAGVLVVIEHEVSDDVLDELVSRTCDSDAAPLCILVTDELGTRTFLRALEHGVVAVLPLRQTDGPRMIKAVLTAQAGGADFPGRFQRALLDHLRHIHRDVLLPHGLTTTGLTKRESDVLAMLAEGFDTREIAAELAYSERTVKYVLQNMMERHEIKHRPHAVAFAIRVGLEETRRRGTPPEG